MTFCLLLAIFARSGKAQPTRFDLAHGEPTLYLSTQYRPGQATLTNLVEPAQSRLKYRELTSLWGVRWPCAHGLFLQAELPLFYRWESQHTVYWDQSWHLEESENRQLEIIGWPRFGIGRQVERGRSQIGLALYSRADLAGLKIRLDYQEVYDPLLLSLGAAVSPAQSHLKLEGQAGYLLAANERWAFGSSIQLSEKNMGISHRVILNEPAYSCQLKLTHDLLDQGVGLTLGITLRPRRLR